jgi:hypothetical protein
LKKVTYIGPTIFVVRGQETAHPRRSSGHSMFADSACSIAAHHRCASVGPVCTCDSVIEGDSSLRRECSCGHPRARLAIAGVCEPELLIEPAAAGIL